MTPKAKVCKVLKNVKKSCLVARIETCKQSLLRKCKAPEWRGEVEVIFVTESESFHFGGCEFSLWLLWRVRILTAVGESFHRIGWEFSLWWIRVITAVGTVVIGNPERHVRKASHCGSEQQKRSPNEITLVVTIRKYNQVFTRFTSIVSDHSPRSL